MLSILELYFNILYNLIQLVNFWKLFKKYSTSFKDLQVLFFSFLKSTFFFLGPGFPDGGLGLGQGGLGGGGGGGHLASIFLLFWLLAKNKLFIEKTPFLENKRGKEIKQWLAEHQDIEDYVLLDDEIFKDFDDEILSHLIKMDDTNTRGIGKGLQLKDVEEIIKRFGRIKSKEDNER